MIDSQKHTKLIEFGTKILYMKSLREGLPLISNYAKSIIMADRCSIFIYDSLNKELWTTLADGIKKLIISSDKGIVGSVLKSKDIIIENNVVSNLDFLQEIDNKTGYKTKNIIAAPIFNYNKEVVGILQLLNKDGGFNKDDLKYITLFANKLGGFIELVNIYKEK